MFSIRKRLVFQGSKLLVIARFVAVSTGGEVPLTLRRSDFLSLPRSQFLLVAIAPTATAV